MRSPNRGWATSVPTVVALVILVGLSSVTLTGDRHGPSGGDAGPRPPAGTSLVLAAERPPHAAPLPPLPSPSGVYRISGSVTGAVPGRVPLVGLNVSLFSRPCTGTATPSTCAFVNHTMSGPNGSFQIYAPPGSYFVVANNSTRWGGAWRAITVGSTSVEVGLRADPLLPYGNATFVLPDWNNLSSYASNCNAAYPCGTGVYGTQNPLLSWTSDGVFYVNRTNELVYYSFANGSVRGIAPWLNLYDDLMQYQGIENTDWITADGSYVYEFGCTSDCLQSSSSPVLFYGVNTTTGQTFRHTFSGVTDADLETNAQVQMIGEDGNASLAVLIDAAGTALAYNIWNRTQWKIGSLAYFEANNIYWFPSLNSFLNVQADGSSSDGLDQVMLEGPAPGTRLVTVVATTYGSNFLCNGVNGVYLNVSSHRIGVSELTGGGPVRTEFWQYDGRGLLTGNYTLVRPETFATWPDNSAPANVYSSEHRPTTTSDGPVYNGIWDGMFQNNSWLYEPSVGQFYASNVTQDHIGRGPQLRQSGMSPASVETMFVNTSYSILSESVNCRTNGTRCPIRGSSPGSVPGTVWWTWKLGLPELPYAANATTAETLPPGPVPFSNTSGPNSIDVTWRPPSTGVDPLVNYTLFWRGLRAPIYHAVDAWAENRSYRIGGLAAASPYSVCLEAWNLHWHDAPTCQTVTTSNPNGPLRLNGFLASPGHVDAGMSLRWTVNGSGGEGPLSFNYSGLPPGCPPVDAASFSCVPTAAGLYRVDVNVTDASGAWATAETRASVAPRFSAVPALVPTIDAGQNLSLAYSVLGSGTPPYSATWTVDGTTYDAPASGTGGMMAPVTNAGPLPVEFVATDALGESAFSNTSVLASLPFIAALNATPTAVDIGVPVRVEAVLGGGTAPTTVTFGMLPSGCQALNATALSCQVGVAGNDQVSATASDSAESSVFLSTNFTVNPDPRVLSFGAWPAAVDLGTAIDWHVATAGGTGPFRLAAAGLPPGCSATAVALTGWTCSPNAPGSYRVVLTVTDADGHSAVAAATLSVHPAAPPAQSSGWLAWALASLGTAAALAAAVGVWRRRRDRPPARAAVSTRP